jgi:hypothetical protein
MPTHNLTQEDRSYYDMVRNMASIAAVLVAAHMRSESTWWKTYIASISTACAVYATMLPLEKYFMTDTQKQATAERLIPYTARPGFSFFNVPQLPESAIRRIPSGVQAGEENRQFVALFKAT